MAFRGRGCIFKWVGDEMHYMRRLRSDRFFSSSLNAVHVQSTYACVSAYAKRIHAVKQTQSFWARCQRKENAKWMHLCCSCVCMCSTFAAPGKEKCGFVCLLLKRSCHSWESRTLFLIVLFECDSFQRSQCGAPLCMIHALEGYIWCNIHDVWFRCRFKFYS